MKQVTISLNRLSDGWRADIIENDRVIDVVNASEINSLFSLLRSKMVYLEYQYIEDVSHSGSFTLW